MLKVLLVDDSVEIQRAFGRLLESLAGVAVVGCAEDVDRALGMVDRLHPDLLVLDIHLRGGDKGWTVLEQMAVHHPGVEAIVLTNSHTPWHVDRCLAAGAKACFDKSSGFRAAMDWIATHGRPAATANCAHVRSA